MDGMSGGAASILFYSRKINTLIVAKQVDRRKLSFPGGSDSKESACYAGDPGLIPELGRSLGEGNGNPLKYSCLENPMDRGTW